MTLANGRHYLAIPGPSVMPDRVLQAMHRPAPNIYHGPLVDLTASVARDLCRVARTKANVAMYIANGHGVWEAALANVLSPGDRVLALCTGRFGHGWADIAQALGAEVERLDFGEGAAVDPARVAEALAADTTGAIKAVLLVQVDTATSVKNDVAALRAALDGAGHDALLMVDSIACLGCDRFEMDAWGVDVMITGCQKGLMTPPGLGFVFFNAKADGVRGALKAVSPYWDWRPRIDPEYYYLYFFGTAPTHHLFGLREALDMIFEEGLEQVWARHARLAQAVWAACDTWGQGGDGIRPNITDPAARSHAVTTLHMAGGAAERLRGWLPDHLGLTLGIPLGEGVDGAPAADVLRIGHMGHVNGHMILGVLGAMQAGMAALQVPHDPAGLEAAARVIGQA